MVSAIRGCSGNAPTATRQGNSLTKTRREQLSIEVSKELLALCIELAHPRDDIARQADTHDLHDGLKDQQREVGKVGMRAVGLFQKDFSEAIVAIFERLRCHGDKVVGVSIDGESTQAQGLGAREKRHAEVSQCLARNWQERCGSG